MAFLILLFVFLLVLLVFFDATIDAPFLVLVPGFVLMVRAFLLLFESFLVVFPDFFLDHYLIFYEIMLHLLHGFALPLVLRPDIFEKLSRYSDLFQVLHLCLNELINGVIHYRGIITSRDRAPTER